MNFHPADRLGESLRPLADEHSGLVHQPPALVGTSDSSLQRWAKVYDHWLTNIQDWCISRQLWWGHRIPVWTKMRSKHN